MGINTFDDTAFSFFFWAVPLLIIGLILFTVLKGVGTWASNNNSPKLSVPAQVVAKRTHTWGGSGDSSARTSYYATFQVESGDRMELQLSGSETGMLAEGDIGVLTFQGKRYLGFERKMD